MKEGTTQLSGLTDYELELQKVVDAIRAEPSTLKAIGILRRKFDVRLELIGAQEEYIKILGDELNGVVGLAAIHGWKSKRFEAGKIAREKIKGLKAKLSNG